jgi:hypothetical protein
MKSVSIYKQMNFGFLLLLGLLLLCEKGRGQLCTNNKDTIYGLTTTGQIVAINVMDGLGNIIGPPTGTAVNSNAVGFSSTTGLFYFFNKNGAAPQQFVSYDPTTAVITVLPVSPIAATHVVRSGCVNNLGSGYYTIDSVNTPVVHSKLLYYNITLNSWSTLTSAFVDPSNNPIPAIDTLISGDMAIDGNNNLWLLCSSKWNYALYEIKAPLPVIPVGSVTVTPVIPLTPIPGTALGKVSFTGAAFNSAGTLFLTLGNNATGNKLFKLTSTSAASLSLIGPITADYGADLTSCAFPSSVLPVNWIDYSAFLQDNSVLLRWQTNDNPNVRGYIVEHSTDDRNWKVITYIERNQTGNLNSQSYYYQDFAFNNGSNYYRIIQTEVTGTQNISETRYVQAAKNKQILIGPNPVVGTLNFLNLEDGIKYYCQVFDIGGRLKSAAIINENNHSIDLSHLVKGTYFIRLNAANSEISVHKFTKW